jgi:predicted AAA+ superfamily ATPase
MLPRQAEHTLQERLRRFPAAVLVGPRQVGKTTLARAVAARHPGAAFFDLERESDRAALRQPELLLPTLRDRLVVLDGVQLAPGLFAALRPEIDDDRRPGRFLLLGSASGELLRQSAESLAGRAATVELTPFLASELQPDLPALGVRVPAETLRRFWTMLAHLQGRLFNASQLGAALGGAAHTTVGRYLDTLVDALMVRRLRPVLPNVGKRLVKSPKVYVRDSGLLHALLGITDVAALQGHPVAGASWEGFVVEQVAGASASKSSSRRRPVRRAASGKRWKTCDWNARSSWRPWRGAIRSSPASRSWA